MQRVEERGTAISTQLLFFELEWAELADERVDELLADDRLEFVPPPPALGPPLPPAPAHRAGGEDPHREGRHRLERVGRACSTSSTSTITIELDGETVGARAGAVAARVARPRGAPGRGRGGDRRARARAAHARVRVQHAARRQGDRRPPAHVPGWIASRNLANEASDESVQALVDAVQGRYDIPQRWYTLKAQLLGIDQLADYDRMASVATVGRRVRLGRGPQRSCSTRTRRSRRELADVAQRFFDEQLDRRAGAAGQAPGRVLRVHGAVAPPVPVAQLDLAPARRAHARARARPRPARVPRARAGRVPPGRRRSRWPRPRRCSARRSRSAGCSTTTDRSRRTAHAAGREPRGPDRDGVPPDRDEPVRERGAHRAPRAGRAVRRRLQRALDRDARPRCSATRSSSPRATAPGGRYIPHFIGTPGYVYAYAYGQLLALSVYRAVRGAGRGLRRLATSSCWRAAGRCRPRSSARSSASTSPIPAFWDGGLDIIEQQLEAAEAAAVATGRVTLPAQ